MARFFFVYGSQEIDIPLGECTIGRGVECHLRFNDAAVSRKHLRVINTGKSTVVYNLSETNQTRVNGELLDGPRELEIGDKVEVGHRTLKVAKDEEGSSGDSQPITVRGPLEVGPGLFVSDELMDSEMGEVTRPGDGPAGILSRLGSDTRNCVKCGAIAPNTQMRCQTCGYERKSGGPSAVTQEINVNDLPKRAGPRIVIDVPILYSSEFLTLDVVARDVSLGGMFLASEILDPVGTECEITALPDGRSALHFKAEVCHVSTDWSGQRPPGFGVSFKEIPGDAQSWLEQTTKGATR